MIRVLSSRLRLFNFRYLREHPARTWLSLGVLTVAAALIVSVIGIYGSVGGSVSRLSQQVAGDAELEITGRTDGGLDASVIRATESVEGVKAAVPLVSSPVTVGGERVLLFGTTPAAAKLNSDLSAAFSEAGEASEWGDKAVLAGPSFDAADDGRVTVESMAGQSAEAQLVGTLDGAAAESVNGGDYLVTSLPLAQKLTGYGDRVQSVMVVTEDGSDTAALRTALADEVGPAGFVAESSFRAEQADKSTEMVRGVTLLVAMMALVVAGFLMFNSMNMAAAERRAQMASLRALGSRRRPIMRDFLAEALVLSLIGAAVGSVFGYGAAAVGVDSLPPVVTDAVDARIELAMPGSAVPLAVLACLLTGVGASWLAARRASQARPVEAMRTADPSTDTGDAGESGVSRGRVLSGIAGAVLMVLAFVVAAVLDGEAAFAGMALFLLGVILLAYALIGQLVTATAWLAAKMGPAGRIAASSVQSAPRRVWATGMTVCLAVAIGAATTGSLQNTVDAASENVSTLSDSDYVVQRAPADVLPVRPLLPRDFQSEIGGVDGVERVVAGQFTYLNMNEGRALLLGVDGASNATAYRLANPEARKSMLDGSGAVVSRVFAKDHDLAKGDTLVLPTPKGEQRVPVADVVDYVSMDVGLIAVSLDSMADWFGPDGASFYEVILAEGADSGTAREDIAALTAEQPYDVNVLTGAESVEATEAAVRQVGSLALLLQWVIAGVAGLALLNTLMLSVVERRRELGILRALGASRRRVRRVILSEAISVSAIGGLAGLVAGTALHYLSMGLMEEAAAITVPFALVPAAIGLAVGAILIAMAGALPPARRAGKVNVVQAIGYE